MTNSNRLETIAAHNQRSLKTLGKAISMGKRKFSLIIVRCNYDIIQQDILQLLRQQCPKNIADFWVPRSTISLYTTIQENFGDRSIDALVLFGLESVQKLDVVLESANLLRDRFRNLSFPLVLWLTDVGLKKLMQNAPDFKSFGSVPIRFSLPDEQLKGLIGQRVNAAVNDAANFYMNPAEVKALQQDIAGRDSNLYPETRAGLDFLLGWDLARNHQLDSAIEKYEESLQFWQESNELEKQGLLLLNLGWIWEEKGEKIWAEARDYFQESLKKFEEARRDDLVGQYIGYLGKNMKNLHEWPHLKVLAQRALKLHESQGDNRQVAKDYAWLAEAALQESKWQEAEKFANQAWEIIEPNISVKERGLYGFILGQALAELRKWEKAIAILEQASTDLENARQTMGFNPMADSPWKGGLLEYDAKLHVDILKKLRDWQSQQKQYREAFQNKLLQRQIESQYGKRAFVGASQLQPPASNLEGKTAEERREIARQIVAALGRKLDINRLVERIKNPQYKITIIYGQSGVGKSSILQAGLIPTLQLNYFEGRDYLPIAIGVYKDWVQSLGQELAISSSSPSSMAASHPSMAALKTPSSSPQLILSHLRENEHRRLFTILIFDQFEEFFFENTDLESRAKFYQFLQESVTIPYLKIILSLREDYLHYLLEFSRNYPLKNNTQYYEEMLYYLGNFSRKDAKAAIRSLTARSQLTLESDLLRELVADLAKQFDGVRPIELQVVGTQLESEEITSLDQYRQLGENPKEVLVERFLAEAVQDCGEENQKVAELVLYLLTNEQFTRPLKSKRELKEDLEKEGLKIEQKQLDLVLEVLVGSGLVLLLPERPENFYQLVHDYLVPFVRQKYEPQLLALQREREERKREQEKSKRLKKIMFFGSIAASVVMAIFAGTAMIFGWQANQQKQSAIKESSLALANESQALTLLNQPFEARLAAVKAGGQLVNNQLAPPTNRFSVVTDRLRQVAYKQPGELFRESNRLIGHQNSVRDVGFSADGQLIATASADNTVKLWNRKGEELQTLTGHEDGVTDVRFSADGQLIASASDDKTVKLWNRNGEELQTLTGHQGSVNAVRFSVDGQLIATVSVDKTVKLWNRNGELLQTLTGHQRSVNAVRFSADGELIASASDDKTVKLWNRNGESLQTLTGHKSWVRDVRFSADGQLIASASDDYTVKLWNRKGELLHTLTGHKSWVRDVRFSADGQLIASVSYDTVKLWNRNGELLQTLSNHEDSVNDVSFNPDGQLIATASRDNTVKLWNRNGELLQTLTGHQRSVNAVRFSADGQLIATASDDNTVKLWNRNGELLQTLTRHQSSVNDVSFSPDGKTIASASRDKTVILWDIWDVNDLMRINCQLVGDYLRYSEEVEESDRDLCDRFL